MDATTAILLLLLLACPLGMFFMHRRGGHGAHGSQTTEHGSHKPAQNGHAGHGCGHSGHGHGGETDQPVPKRDERKSVDFDPAAR
jgi:hypothetical protein